MAELRAKGDCIAGDKIKVECRKPGNWVLFRMSGQHKGIMCVAEKNAKATILKEYTNIRKT
jgi:hypothetical protein